MTRKVKTWLIVAAPLLVFLITVWFLATPLGFAGGSRWIFRGVLWFLGFVIAGVSLWFLLRKRAAPATPADTKDDDIDATVAAAATHLASSRLADGARLGKLPMVLILGSDGSGKTTAVVRSGLEPELLAGEVGRGESVAPTRSVNVWYALGAVLLEAGGSVTIEPSRWARLIRHLQPRRLLAVLGRGAQAPRVAVVCFSCEEFRKPGGAEAVQAAAQTLRTRLAQVSHRLGIRLPVYVLFTKADQIPFFADYVQNFSRDEARQVLGVTLPADSGTAGLYADREMRRLTDAFERLFRSLAEKRLQFLLRENSPTRKPGAYEFPREFRKISPLAVQFLIDLCKPSQLQVSPFLRGFYFTGVHAVVVNDAAPAPAQKVAPLGAYIGATSVFDPSQIRGASAEPMPANPVSRRVSQLFFLGRLFPDVILSDQAALGVTRGGTRVSWMRRVLLGSVAALALLLAAGFTVSYLGNRELQADALAAARGLGPLPSVSSELPNLDALRRLDAVRAQVARLGEYEREGAPWRLRWGLYTGSALYPRLRRLYFAGFQQLMFGATYSALVNSMRTLPDAPRDTSEYRPTYNTLKAYLITTAQPARSTAEFLTPVLMERWLNNRQLDADRTQLAKRQFDFYSQELRVANPYLAQTDSVAVTRARTFLLKFAGAERIYQFMIGEAGKRHAPLQFNRRFDGSSQFVENTYEVPGAFTRGGWAFMQDALANAERFLQGESWVIGEQASTQLDRTRLIQELRARYLGEYVQHWRTYLQSASVVRYANVKDAAQKLAVLSNNQSPLLAMFSLASRNTSVDSKAVANAFQPVQKLTPPGDTTKLVSEGNAPYVSALGKLYTALEQLANAPVGTGDAVGAQAAAAEAKNAARQVAAEFQIDNEANLHTTVQKLMEDPITHAEALLRNFGSAELNARGRGFCAPFRRLMAKYPFNPAATEQATVAEASDMFRPGTGALWTFYDEVLQKSLVREGSRFVPRPGATVALSPAFVNFFSRAAAFSDALFPAGAAEPRLTFTLRPRLLEVISSVTVSIDGQTASFTQESQEARQFVWVGATAKEAQLSGQVGDTPVLRLPFQGPWALFELFHAVDRWQTAGTTHTVEWTMRTRGQREASAESSLRVVLELDMGGLPPVLNRNYFAGVSCGGQIAR